METEYLGRCTLLGVIDLPPAKNALFDTHDHALTLQVNRRYRFFFANVVFIRPYITAAIAGSDDLCPTRVITVLDRTPMDEGDVVPVTVEGHRFTIRRNADKSDFKYFTLDFPPTL